MPLAGVLFLAFFVFLFGVGILFLASKIGPTPTNDPVKLAPYECGMPVEDKRDSKVSVKFYLTAILFIIFDIEIIFMYPWAITFKEFITSGQGIYIGSVMGIFILIFIFGLFWEIKSKALEWE